MRIDGIELTLQFPLPKADAAMALAGASIRVAESGIHAVTGPSGCGKSSLLYVLAGLRPPTAGTVYYDNVDIQSLCADALAHTRRSKFGVIFQQHFLLDALSVLDNVLVPLNSADKRSRQEAQDLLALLGLEGLGQRMPYELSHGQRQRVAVARALVNNPEVIFADEPTAALDRESTLTVMDVLAERRQRSAILLITHDPQLLERADTVFRMKDGRILAHP